MPPGLSLKLVGVKMEIKIDSPTRVDLAGGTLDCWPLYAIIGDCKTINISININTGVVLRPKDGIEIELNIKDLNYRKIFLNLEELLQSKDQELSLVKDHFKFWGLKQGFYLETYSQSPIGGGLGGSSSLTISLLKAFGQFVGKKWSLNEIVTVASNLEAKLLRTPTGTQDYFSPAQPGLNIISYTNFGFESQLIELDEDYFNSRMILVYTGKAHHSGINNWQVIKQVVERDERAIGALKEIADIAESVAEVCKCGHWDNLGPLFAREYEARVKLSEGFTCNEIKELERIAFKQGANAVKICGAGGGGCVMLWVPPEKKMEIIAACQKEKYQVLKAEVISGNSSLML